MRILFMGTPEIAVACLDALIRDGQEIIGAVTAPDKPAGRGRTLQAPPVKTYAEKAGIKILQPENLRSEVFLKELRALDPELIIVVAFRMLPEKVWNYPEKGTVNLHASLLPQYRGAAPINRVIMNGETETGVSTFYIGKEIDTGNIILREAIRVEHDENAGSLHDRIVKKGAALLVKTVKMIKEGDATGTPQSELTRPGEILKTAPKLFKEDCRIDWKWPVKKVYDHIRGLSPYPGAWTVMKTPGGLERTLKIYAAMKIERDSIYHAGTLLTDGKNRFEVVCRDGLINLKEVQGEGKKKMGIAEFVRGIPELQDYEVI